jgi:hypothetical protein
MLGPAVRPRGIAARIKRGCIGSGSSSLRVGSLGCHPCGIGYLRTFCTMFSGLCGRLIALTLTSTATAGWASSVAPAPRGGLGGAISG